MCRKSSEKKRKFRVHPLWQQRSILGAHNSLAKEMVIYDPTMLTNYIRMSVSTYEKLLLKVGSKLESCPTRKDIITPSEKLMVTLRDNLILDQIILIIRDSTALFFLRWQMLITCF
ncbi:uncharacterized protein LOC127279021 [Leptopilina boulardi]|uniref:uncharacterized protein LOC127279021 n=1 Tax=Leptopilina boulardi TaxID=63433 RepID=UPI0021F69881|nr:uncharacterized protein LOC127279021 [Leptopilina boulardi]